MNTAPTPNPTPPPFASLTVIGLGLIGGSIALAARSVYGPGLQIRAIDPHPETLQFALRERMVDTVLRDFPKAAAWPPIPQGQELILLAAPLAHNRQLLAQLAPMVKDCPVVVSDVGSCKRQICELGATLLPRQFIGGHPMTGKEKSGIAASTGLLFAGKPWYLAEEHPLLAQFVTDLGAKPMVLDPVTHDAAMAWVSHGPQLLSVLLAESLYRNRPGERLPLAGGGLRDMLRLAGSDYAVWKDIFEENADNLRAVLDQWQCLLGELGGDVSGAAMAGFYAHANRVAVA